MADLIIFVIISIIMAGLILVSLYKFNTGMLIWAVLLLMIVSAFSGRWHKYYLPRWYQVKFESIANNASNTNDTLRTQIREYDHHNNAHIGFASLKHYYRSSFALGQSQDNSIKSTHEMIKFPIKKTISPKMDFKEQQRIGKQQIKLFDSHKYVGKGNKIDHIVTVN